MVFFQSAENTVNCAEWLTQAIKDGWAPDVCGRIGMGDGLKSANETLGPYFHLKIHEYEMTHNGGGNRTAKNLMGKAMKAFKDRRQVQLLWGEDFLITDELIASAKGTRTFTP